MGSGWSRGLGAAGCAYRVALVELSHLRLLSERVLYDWVGGKCWDVDCGGGACQGMGVK